LTLQYCHESSGSVSIRVFTDSQPS
jgi:hypothetical protein